MRERLKFYLSIYSRQCFFLYMELSGLIGFMMVVNVRMLNVEFVVHLLLHEYDVPQISALRSLLVVFDVNYVPHL